MIVRRSIILVLAFISLTQAANRRFTLLVGNVSCSSYDSVVAIYNCDVKKVAPNNYFLNEEFMYDRDFGVDAQYHIYVYITTLNAVKAVKFLDIKFNICKFLDSSTVNSYMKSIMTEIWRSSNMPFECPLKANYLYTTSNFSISDKMFPTYTPYMKFNFSFDTYYNNKLVARFLLDGSIVRSK